jgi:hypothetical protein
MIEAEHFGFVVGIDTHAKTHTLAIIGTATGGEIANETFRPPQPEATAPCPGSCAAPALPMRRFYSPWREQGRTARNVGNKPPTPASK